MRIQVPELSLVVMVGTTGSGKSTFARTHFKPTEVLSSDVFRGLVSDDENDQAATGDAFDALHFVAAKRLAAGRLTVIDATNVQPDARKPLVALARRYHVLPVAIVLDIPERICEDRNRSRPDRAFGPHVLARQRQALKRSISGLQREGFRHVWVLKPEDVEDAVIERQPLWNNRKDLTGPFDIVGDIHGCGDELEALLTSLGYEVVERREGTALDAGPVYRHRRRADGAVHRRPRRPRAPGPGHPAHRLQHGPDRRRAHGHGQPRAEARPRPERTQRPGHPRPRAEPRRDRGRPGRRATGARRGPQDLARRPRQPLRPRRRPARHRPRRPQGGDAGPRIGRSPRVRALRRHDRRDRRVRPAGAPRLGRRLPGQGDGRLRPHARPRGRVAQQHDRHRHGCRVRRQAHRPPIPRA